MWKLLSAWFLAAEHVTQLMKNALCIPCFSSFFLKTEPFLVCSADNTIAVCKQHELECCCYKVRSFPFWVCKPNKKLQHRPSAHDLSTNSMSISTSQCKTPSRNSIVDCLTCSDVVKDWAKQIVSALARFEFSIKKLEARQSKHSHHSENFVGHTAKFLGAINETAGKFLGTVHLCHSLWEASFLHCCLARFNDTLHVPNGLWQPHYENSKTIIDFKQNAFALDFTFYQATFF